MTNDVDKTLAERDGNYGDFEDNAKLATALFSSVMAAPGSDKLTSLHTESLRCIFTKVSRIVNGNPNFADSWHDIGGYARIVEKKINKEYVPKRKK